MKKLIVLLAIVLVASVAIAQTPAGQGKTVLNGGIVEAFVNVPGAGPTPYGPGLGRHDLYNPTTNSPLGCETCHLPHTAPTYGASFLWAWKSVPSSVATYKTDFTLNAGGPLTMGTARSGATRSLLCLSCHDAASANSNGVVGAFKLIDTVGGVALGGGTGANSPLSKDLSGQHPVDANIPAYTDYQQPNIVGVGTLEDSADGTIGVDVALPLWDGQKVECSTCHDQHNDYTNLNNPGGPGAPFLRWANTNGTALCRQCHNK